MAAAAKRGERGVLHTMGLVGFAGDGSGYARRVDCRLILKFKGVHLQNAQHESNIHTNRPISPVP